MRLNPPLRKREIIIPNKKERTTKTVFFQGNLNSTHQKPQGSTLFISCSYLFHEDSIDGNRLTHFHKFSLFIRNFFLTPKSLFLLNLRPCLSQSHLSIPQPCSWNKHILTDWHKNANTGGAVDYSLPVILVLSTVLPPVHTYRRNLDKTYKILKCFTKPNAQ